MSYFVYVLRSIKDQKLYVGCTSDITKRFLRHQTGQVTATKNRRPLELIHTEKIEDKATAFNRERFLKSLWGAREKKKILTEYMRKIGRKSS